MGELRFERTVRDCWAVYDGERLVGKIVGGGPTAATKYKAITDDDEPPLGYGYTKEQAGQFLAIR